MSSERKSHFSFNKKEEKQSVWCPWWLCCCPAKNTKPNRFQQKHQPSLEKHQKQKKKHQHYLAHIANVMHCQVRNQSAKSNKPVQIKVGRQAAGCRKQESFFLKHANKSKTLDKVINKQLVVKTMINRYTKGCSKRQSQSSWQKHGPG